MTQQRFNNLMILHVHQEFTDAIDIDAVLQEFIATSEGKQLYFN